MTDQELFLALERWNYWDGKEFPLFVNRKEIDFLYRYLEGNLVQIIKGARRTGKSSLLKILYRNLVEKNNIYSVLFINLDDITLIQEESSPKLLERIYQLYRQRIYPKGKTYILIDEIQKINNWEQWVETYRETGNAKFILSGSSSKLSSKELGSLLTGRHIDLTLFPFSFKDYIANRVTDMSPLSIDLNKNQIKKSLFSYFTLGGFPEVLLNYSPEDGEKILETYFEDIIYRDIVDRWEIRDTGLLKRIALFSIKNSGNLISYRQIKRMIEQIYEKTSTNTISEYISHLLESFIIFEVPLYTNSVKKSNQSPRKIYSIDTGLRKAVLKPLTEDYGRDAENIVFVELLRRGYHVSYWRTGKTELDFIANGKKNYAINVTMSNLEYIELKERELKGLLEFPGKNYERILITDDLEDIIEIHGKKITLIPLWKWLLT
ncbi:MAG: ATP-binding protein [Thermotogota bacterium]|nr:ATP-binding protein [Thermotogota bacterium]